MGNFATDKLGAGTILWSATERPIVAPNGTLYWDVIDEHFYIRKFDAWVVLSEGGSTGTIGGSIALNQIAVGAGVNTITGSSALTFVTTGPASNEIDIGNSVNSINVNTSLGNMLIQARTGGTSGQIQLSPGIQTGVQVNSVAGVQSVVFFSNGNGGIIFASNSMTFSGSTSGAAAIGVNNNAGTSNKINLPTTTGTVGQALITDGNNPQQTSWATFAGLNSPAFTGTPTAPTAALGTNTTQLATTAFVIANSPREIASGTATLTANAALGITTSQAAITVAGAGILTTDSIEWAYATAPTAGDSLAILSPYVTSGNVNFVRSNPTGAAQNVSALVVNWRVIR